MVVRTEEDGASRDPTVDISLNDEESEESSRLLSASKRMVIIEGANPSTKLSFKLKPEMCRFFAYASFWLMCAVAIFLTETVTRHILLAGPDEEGSTCGPFDLGVGFDIKEDSHLMRAFGFNNICSNWDYTPSREITALVYPLFEYTLLIYLLADFFAVVVHWKKGWVSTRFMRIFQVLFPIMIILTAWFRMIFVIVAYENVQGHTAGFMGLQVVLILVACMNVLFVTETKIEYKVLGGRKGTLIAAYVYLFGNLVISSIKLYLTAMVVFGAGYPSWANTAPNGGMVPAQKIDAVWMIFNAILPFILSYVRWKTESPLEIEIDMNPFMFSDDE